MLSTWPMPSGVLENSEKPDKRSAGTEEALAAAEFHFWKDFI